MPYLKITLQSDLCAGSGESFGNRVDTDVCLDAFGLPIIPARRIKGCLREVAQMLCETVPDRISARNIDDIFGAPNTETAALQCSDAFLADAVAIKAGLSALAPSDLLHPLAQPAAVSALFTSVRAQTALDKGTGVAKDGSLRFTRVVCQKNPRTPAKNQVFYAPIALREVHYPTMQMLCKALRHLGMHQTRGLGAVQCEFCEGDVPNATPKIKPPVQPAIGEVTLQYQIRLDASLSLYEGELLSTAIPASSVIGCLAQYYLETVIRDDSFYELFHSTAVRFSAITPVINGVRSLPTPLNLVYLKNKGRYANRYAPSFAQDKGEKQKTLQGTYAAPTADGFAVASPKVQTAAHHAFERVSGGVKTQQSTLYTQDALCSGQLYAGEITAPAALMPTLHRLLCNAPLRFGRSRSAQYGSCQLTAITAQPVCAQTITPKGRFYLVLSSDLLLGSGGIYTLQNAAVRTAICDALGLPAEPSAPPTEEAQDWCIYRRVGGYQSAWGLRKPEREVLCAGSVLSFMGTGAPLPRTLTIGEEQQQGFGQCTLYTADEIGRAEHIQKGTVDATPLTCDEGNIWNSFTSTLLLQHASETVTLRAQTIAKHPALTGKATAAFVGRLRLMLLESGGSFNAFLRTANAIPANTNANKKRKAFAQQFCQALLAGADLGQGDDFGAQLLQSPVSYALALLGDDVLFRALSDAMGQREAAMAVLGLWYPLAEQTLTLLKYQLRTPKAAEQEATHA